MVPYKVGKKFYIKMYGIEYELILPIDEDAKASKARATEKAKAKLVTEVVK